MGPSRSKVEIGALRQLMRETDPDGAGNRGRGGEYGALGANQRWGSDVWNALCMRMAGL
jgi:hypothetical protein